MDSNTKPSTPLFPKDSRSSYSNRFLDCLNKPFCRIAGCNLEPNFQIIGFLEHWCWWPPKIPRRADELDRLACTRGRGAGPENPVELCMILSLYPHGNMVPWPKTIFPGYVDVLKPGVTEGAHRHNSRWPLVLETQLNQWILLLRLRFLFEASETTLSLMWVQIAGID